MRLKRITDASDSAYGRAIELYGRSFPCHEQRESKSQEEILADDDYRFCVLYDGDLFFGEILYWEHTDFIYIEHFCILPEMRNKGLGQKALELLCRQNKTIILEIDPPKDDVSRRRKGFYEKCGFEENPFSHIHPPYHKGNCGHDLILMTYPKRISRELFDEFGEFLNNKVMKNAFDES